MSGQYKPGGFRSSSLFLSAAWKGQAGCMDKPSPAQPSSNAFDSAHVGFTRPRVYQQCMHNASCSA
jgi:hypothetical protein